MLNREVVQMFQLSAAERRELPTGGCGQQSHGASVKKTGGIMQLGNSPPKRER